MSKFKTGDRVQVLESDRAYAGTLATVTGFRGGYGCQVEVKFDSGNKSNIFEKDLMTAPANYFRVGDRVYGDFSADDRRVGTVTDLNPTQPRGDDSAVKKIAVRFDDYPYHNDKDFHHWNPRRLHPVPTPLLGLKNEIETGKTLNIGDRVQSKFSDGEMMSGTVVGVRGEYASVRFDNYTYMDDNDRHTREISSMGLLRHEKNMKDLLGRAFGMSEKKIAEHARKSTVSATFVLASGREVRMPDPPEKDWELDDTTPFAFGVGVMISAGFVHVAGYMMKDSDTGEMIGKVTHEQGLCWIKDMERIVNERKKVSVFEDRFACIKELRYYKERIIDAEFDDLAFPTLRAYLW